MGKLSRLNPNAQKWVDALRSGKYKQNQSNLRSGDRFCCLGVACDISGIGTWSDFGYMIDSYSSPKLLPREVQCWIGLIDPAGCFGETHLAYENDHGATFADIADLIEAHAEELGVSA